MCAHGVMLPSHGTYRALCVVKCDVIPGSKLQQNKKALLVCGPQHSAEMADIFASSIALKETSIQMITKKTKNSWALQFLKFKEIYLLLLLRLFNVLRVLQKELEFFKGKLTFS